MPKWLLEGTEVSASPTIVKLGLGIHPFKFSQVSGSTKPIKNMDLYFDLMFTHRIIQGDFGNMDYFLDGKQVSNRAFNGFEAIFNLELNQFRIYTSLTVNKTKDDQLIPGFNGTQFVFGFVTTGDLLSFD